MTLGTELKQARIRSGRTLRQIEAETGISNGYLSQLEADKILQPSPKHLFQLAVVYELSYADLMALAGYATTQDKAPRMGAAQKSLVRAVSELNERDTKRVREYIELLKAARKKK